jgi:hypothetical protein
MDVLLRHTLLGDCIRGINSSYLPHPDEQDPSVQKSLRTFQNAQSARADENTALLTDGEDTDASRTLVVDWYGNDDYEVSILPFDEG